MEDSGQLIEALRYLFLILSRDQENGEPMHFYIHVPHNKLPELALMVRDGIPFNAADMGDVIYWNYGEHPTEATQAYMSEYYGFVHDMNTYFDADRIEESRVGREQGLPPIQFDDEISDSFPPQEFYAEEF